MGAKNRNTRALQQLKDRIIATVGMLDETAPEKDWLVELARKHPKLFVTLLARVLPTSGTLDVGGDSITLKIVKMYDEAKNDSDGTTRDGDAASADLTPPDQGV